jgi:hypothetical protein
VECPLETLDISKTPYIVYFQNYKINISKEFKLDPKENKTRLSIMPKFNQKIPWGFFDGTFQGHPPRCGVGVVLFINQITLFI